MKQFIKKYIHNRYFYTALAFVIWMAFFDNDNLQEQLHLTHKIKQLEKQKSFYQTEIQKNRNALNALKYDTSQLEKFAREKYFMKKENEDIYVVIRPKTK